MPASPPLPAPSRETADSARERDVTSVRVGLRSPKRMRVEVLGGRPAMISAATGAVALVIAPVVREHGLDHLVATVILAGIIQLAVGLTPWSP